MSDRPDRPDRHKPTDEEEAPEYSSSESCARHIQSLEDALADCESVADTERVAFQSERELLNEKLAEMAALNRLRKLKGDVLRLRLDVMNSRRLYTVFRLILSALKNPISIRGLLRQYKKLSAMRSKLRRGRVSIRGGREPLTGCGILNGVTLDELISASLLREGESQASRTLRHAGRDLKTLGELQARSRLMNALAQAIPDLANLKAAFWAALHAEDLDSASGHLDSLRGLIDTAAESEVIRKMSANLRARVERSTPYRILDLIEKAHLKEELTNRVKGRVAYTLHNSLPYSSGGYATRTHGLACGLLASGYEPIGVLRPGYPGDVAPELELSDQDRAQCIDGVQYLFTPYPSRKGRPTVDYVEEACDVYEELFNELRPEYVMSASNYVTALPALIAAKRLGLPFIYEVRGFWEITRMSRDPGFAETEVYRVQRELESAVCRAADLVFTLTPGMKEELIGRGIPDDKIAIAPNACDPLRFESKPRDEGLAEKYRIPSHVPVIGYIGTFVDYEGLEDLAEACGKLHQEGYDFRLLLVGSENTSGTGIGGIANEIKRIAVKYGFPRKLIMPGRVPHDEVESNYSLIDIAPFPRKPWPVCEMVSPMKPLEALAMEKAVIVSDVRALSEMIEHEFTGLHFKKGDVDSLVAALRRLLDGSELRQQFGTAGRQWVEEKRTWSFVASHMADQFKSIGRYQDGTGG